MKLLAILGSPRKNGNTFAVVDEFVKKISSLDKEISTEYVFLADEQLETCKGCCNCLTIGENFCPNKDARAVLEEKILSCDALIIASPVYAMNMTALMKNFMDRLAFTMHRPRFFNQKTIIIATTGYGGLKETINSIAQLKYSGFNIIQTLGLVVKQPLTYNPELDEKTIKKINVSAEKFYKKLKNKAPLKPSFSSIMQFKAQRRVFEQGEKEMPADYAYFKSKNWFDKKRKHYVENARVGSVTNFISDLLVRNI